jgi:uncharacterized membrane protein
MASGPEEPDGSTDWPRNEATRRAANSGPPSSDFMPSPYPPADVLATCVAIEPDLVARALERIDAETDHRRRIELKLVARNECRLDLAQIMAFVVALSGTVGALVAGYLGVPSAVCIAAIVFCIGGPNAATVLARVLDRRQG